MLFFSSAPNILHIQLKKEKKKTTVNLSGFLITLVWEWYFFLMWLFSSKIFTTDLLSTVSFHVVWVWGMVLVSLCCYKKDTTEWVVHKQQKFNPQNSRGWPRLLRPRHQHTQRLVRACFLSHRSPPSRLCAYGRKGREPSSASFITALILFRRALPSWPKSLL